MTLKRIGYTRETSDPEGGFLERDSAGDLTGVLTENAMEPLARLRQPPGVDDYAKLLRLTTDSFLSLGITSTTDALVGDPNLLRAYQAVQSDPTSLRMRYTLMFDHWEMLDPALDLGLITGLGDRWLRVGAMKFFIDGTEGQRTAKLSEPFTDDPGNTGMWMFPPEEFRERVLLAHTWEAGSVPFTRSATRRSSSHSIPTWTRSYISPVPIFATASSTPRCAGPVA